MSTSKFKDKVIIVTGANGLIGRPLTSQLRATGAKLVCADINIEPDENTDIFKCDVTNPASVKQLVEQVISKYGRIDGLVNNAYPRTADWGTKFEDIPLESWQKNVDTQMNSVFYMCQLVLKHMQAQSSGSIVNIGSIYGVVGNDFTIYEGYGGTSPAAYAAIKGGIINFTRYLASYYGKYNIRVNCVSPGGIRENQHPSFIERYESKSPLKRMANAEEMAPAIMFLLSEDASYITGHNLMVDGGWTAI